MTRSPLMTIFSLVLIAMGIVTVVWVSSSMVGTAHSQESPGVAAPERMMLPPNPEQEAAFKKMRAEAAAKAAAEPPPPEPMAEVPAPPPVPEMNNVPPPAMDLPPPVVGLPPPVDTPAFGKTAFSDGSILAGIPNPEGYTYDPTGRRDPFRPFGQSQIMAPVPAPIPIPAQQSGVPSVLQPPTPLAQAEPLQQYDLAQLKVVGIVWEVRGPKRWFVPLVNLIS